MRPGPLVFSLLGVFACSSSTVHDGTGGASSSRTSSTADVSTTNTGAGGSGAGGANAFSLPTGRFRIGMWCGPPASELTKARFDQIAAAGFTTVSNACDGSTYNASYGLQVLSLAAQDGLDAIVSDSRLSAALAGTDVVANLDAVVADYANQPALAGYFIGDEPSVASFPPIANLVAGLAARDPAHFAYVNLLPDYASSAQLGVGSYDQYVEQFLTTVSPSIVSWDYYPFLGDGTEAATFFADMNVFRAHAIAHQTPFFQFTQAISFNGHRSTTLAEKEWVGMQTLAAGGAGISYFTYWTPPQTTESFGNAIIDPAGNPTAQYDEVKTINQRLSAFGRYLVASRSVGVFQNGPLPSGTTPRVPKSIVYLPTAAQITVGLFSVDATSPDGATTRKDAYALLVNRSYTTVTESDAYLAPTAAAPETLNVASGAFVEMPVLGSDARGTRVHVSLAPGDATLVHLAGPVPDGALGAEAFVGTVRADAGTLDVVDSSFGAASLRASGWDECPTGYTLGGHDFQSNGFWICVRDDLSSHTFYVGNVVSDSGTIFAIQNGVATSNGNAGWDTCPAGNEIGKRFESNGFWVCLQ